MLSGAHMTPIARQNNMIRFTNFSVPWQGLSKRAGFENRHRTCRFTRHDTACYRLRPYTDHKLGSRDTNLTRVRRAEQYLIQCDEVFFVANINRVITNQSVMDFLRSSASPTIKIERNVSIICTHADVGHFNFKLVSSC